MKEMKDAEFVIADTNMGILDELSERIGLFLWDAYHGVLDGLKNAYLEMEGWIEERMGDVTGDMQGGSIDVVTAEEVSGWKAKMGAVLGGV